MNEQDHQSRQLSEMRNRIMIDEKEAAALVNMSVRTLQAWRVSGKGPPHCKLGRSVRYLVGDVITWVEAQRVQSKP
jgi:predicted DNA-binding transcriptional regulator AlpA